MIKKFRLMLWKRNVKKYKGLSDVIDALWDWSNRFDSNKNEE